MSRDSYLTLLKRSIRRLEAHIASLEKSTMYDDRQAMVAVWKERIAITRAELDIAGELPPSTDFEKRWVELVRRTSLMGSEPDMIL